MVELIAKRYIKALRQSMGKEELKETLELLQVISDLFKYPEIRGVLLSPEIKEEQKAKLLLETLKPENGKIVNLIKLLAQKRRIPMIPALARELEREIAIMEGRFTGCLYSDFDLTPEEIGEIAKALEKRVGGEIELKECGGYDGIKVEIDIVGLEIDFSRSKIKKQIIENILKAI
ncbi:MAG: F0F1 ATP synthase subunit delta [Epsilonproteobacteria bacterium]|nr:hypothetical protein [Campylobacterota bacterium]NPA56674.1 F0F1 ATP synthase subunit delta [Campylobacterota bacterium]